MLFRWVDLLIMSTYVLQSWANHLPTLRLCMDCLLRSLKKSLVGHSRKLPECYTQVNTVSEIQSGGIYLALVLAKGSVSAVVPLVFAVLE
ncbi:hypothetical protein LX36DRAFT_116207 [Colletotrichum falcatum]|nr:hypothetical protein LX36DRAFT_116207 [Colletotrichum falcatum]